MLSYNYIHYNATKGLYHVGLAGSSYNHHIPPFSFGDKQTHLRVHVSRKTSFTPPFPPSHRVCISGKEVSFRLVLKIGFHPLCLPYFSLIIDIVKNPQLLSLLRSSISRSLPNSIHSSRRGSSFIIYLLELAKSLYKDSSSCCS